MKKIPLLAFFLISCGSLFKANAQIQYKIVTTIESIVPGGFGRSRMIESKEPTDHKHFTTEKADDKKSSPTKVKGKDTGSTDYKETKLLNLYSLTGINFQHVASNDAAVTSKLNKMAANGWKLFTVVSGVESDGGEDDGSGIFITRYIFMKNTREED